MPEASILISDPSPTRRKRLVIELAQNCPDAPVVAQGDDPFEVIARGAGVRIDKPPTILIMNIDPPELHEIGALAKLRSLLPSRIAFIALTDGASKEGLEAALAMGVMGLHQLHVSGIRLAAAINRVSQGEFDFDEALVEKARSLLLTADSPGLFRVGGLEVNLEGRSVKRWGVSIHVSNLEFDVLAYLLKNHGRPISSAELLSVIWKTQINEGGTIDQVKSCIKRLRRKIEPIPQNPRYLRFLPRQGYVVLDFTAESYVRPKT